MVFGLLDFKKQLKLYMRVGRLQDTLAFSCILVYSRVLNVDAANISAMYVIYT